MLCVPDVENLRMEVIRDCHQSKFMIHPEGTKLYQDMKRSFTGKA